MKKLKALLILGLMSISSMSFAAYVTPTLYTEWANPQDGDTVGSIEIGNGDYADFSGALGLVGAERDGDSSTVYWDLTILGSSDLLTVGWANNTINPDGDSDLVTTFLEWDGMAWSVFATFTESTFSLILSGGDYLMGLTGLENTGYSGSVSAVPVPAAGILFASALLGAGAFGRRKKKTSAVSAFARAS